MSNVPAAVTTLHRILHFLSHSHTSIHELLMHHQTLSPYITSQILSPPFSLYFPSISFALNPALSSSLSFYIPSSFFYPSLFLICFPYHTHLCFSYIPHDTTFSSLFLCLCFLSLTHSHYFPFPTLYSSIPISPSPYSFFLHTHYLSLSPFNPFGILSHLFHTCPSLSVSLVLLSATH